MYASDKNESGHGPAASIPPEIRGWNWGAFLLSWLWGLFNGTYIALLCFVPFLNFIMIVLLGLKGNEWAWRNKSWESVHEFKRKQRQWAIGGLCFLLVSLATVAVVIFAVVSIFSQSEPYKDAVKLANTVPEIKDDLGSDIKQEGIPSGNIEITNANGKVDMAFPFKGSKGKGTIYLKGVREAGLWSYSVVKFSKEGKNQRLNLVDRLPGTKASEKIKAQ